MNALPLLFPPRLAPGDLIGVTATASPPDKPEKIDEALKRLASFGFKIREGRHLRARDGYLAGGDEQRAEDLNAMFADPEVKGIIALRGGYGSCRILPLIDYAAIRAHPKPFLGYSDNTALHVAMAVKAGVVTFHGPNASEALLPENEDLFRRRLMLPGGPADEVLFSPGLQGDGIKTVVSGQVSGPLLGGNMTCLLRLLATPYAPDFRGAILFLEDIGEKAYRIDGMFTHLRLAGALDQIGGLILGHFNHTDSEEQARIATCLQREAERIGVPCVSGAPIGHFPGQVIIPHGAQAQLDPAKGSLILV
jgi:muramoyltetrapeptide carboxypeptidase